MARILAVDFGEKRIGLATSDASGSLATPRITLRRKSDAVVIEELARFCGREEIALSVFGIPRSPEGVESPIAARIRSFAAKFGRAHGPAGAISRGDADVQRGGPAAAPAGPPEDLDRTAAAVLLEDYLASAGPEAR